MNDLPCNDIPSLLEHLDGAASEDQSRPALTFYRGRAAAGRITYAGLAAEVRRIAAYLQSNLGLRRGQRVAILSPNRLEIPVLILAITSLGGVVVPLNPGAPEEDWAYVLAHSAARFLFVSAAPRDAETLAVASLEQVIAIDDLATAAGRQPLSPAAPMGAFAGEPAIVLYTSGTTGNPKGVELSHRSLLANAWSLSHRLRLHRSTQLAVLPLHHAHAFGFGLMTSLLGSGHLVFTGGFDPFAWADIVRQESVEVTSVFPTLLPLFALARVRQESVPTLRGILVSSAPLDGKVACEFERQTGIRLTHGWGLSEYTNFACCLPLDQDADEHRKLLFEGESPSVGTPLEGTEVSVRDIQGNPLPEGERGELWVRGPCRMLGYHHDDDATRREMVSDWLRTGDEGLFRIHRGEPFFFVTGRLKEIIIRDGEKLSPTAIERRILEKIPELGGRLAIVGFPHRLHGEEVGAYVESEQLPDELRARLVAVVEAMPTGRRPSVVLHGSAPIPRTHTGKVKRRSLRGAFAAQSGHSGPLAIIGC